MRPQHLWITMETVVVRWKFVSCEKMPKHLPCPIVLSPLADIDKTRQLNHALVKTKFNTSKKLLLLYPGRLYSTVDLYNIGFQQSHIFSRGTQTIGSSRNAQKMENLFLKVKGNHEIDTGL